MSNQLVLALTIRIIIGFIAATVSIMLWSKTRDGAWLTMVLGVVFLYVESLLEVLDLFGFILYRSIVFSGVEILPLIFELLPFIFFSIGMSIFVIRIRKY